MQYVVTTRSVLTANPVMVFQLESQEIPYSVREDDFLVQVALSVDGVNGSKVPRQLEDASTLSVITGTEALSTLSVISGTEAPSTLRYRRTCT